MIRMATRRRGLGSFRLRGLGDDYSGFPYCATNVDPANSLRATFGWPTGPGATLNYPTAAVPGKTWLLFPQGNIQMDSSQVNFPPGQGCFIPAINGYLMPQNMYAVYSGQVSGSNIVNASDATLNTVPATAAPASAPTQSSSPAAAPTNNVVVSSAPAPGAGAPASSAAPGFIGQIQNDLTGGNGFSLSSVPWWVWLLGGGAAIWGLSKA